MLTDKEIQQVLHAGRVVPLPVKNPHGPFGLENLAAVVARIEGSALSHSREASVRRWIELPGETWEKLDQLAKRETAAPGSLSASKIAAAIIEQFLSNANQT